MFDQLKNFEFLKIFLDNSFTYFQKGLDCVTTRASWSHLGCSSSKIFPDIFSHILRVQTLHAGFVCKFKDLAISVIKKAKKKRIIWVGWVFLLSKNEIWCLIAWSAGKALVQKNLVGSWKYDIKTSIRRFYFFNRPRKMQFNFWITKTCKKRQIL